MATAEQLRALLESHVEGNDERFFGVMMQLAAHAARQGHGRVAQELRAMLDKARESAAAPARPARGPTPVAQPRGELGALLAAAYPTVRLGDLVLRPDVRDQLQRVVLEQRQRDKLLGRGLAPRRKLLLVGPPGTGKTLTARALAGELHLPLFNVLLHGIITKYLGETAAKLRLVFDAVAHTRGVYLFDEFDALGSERGNPNDVGEAGRTLSSFLQFFEQDESDSVLVAATNHPALLDRALFRRFDDILELALPGPDLAVDLMRARLSSFPVDAKAWDEAGPAAAGLSFAEIAKACDDAAKEAILVDADHVSTKALLRALARRHDGRNQQHRPGG